MSGGIESSRATGQRACGRRHCTTPHAHVPQSRSLPAPAPRPTHPDLQLPPLLLDVEHQGGALLPAADCAGHRQHGAGSVSPGSAAAPAPQAHEPCAATCCVPSHSPPVPSTVTLQTPPSPPLPPQHAPASPTTSTCPPAYGHASVTRRYHPSAIVASSSRWPRRVDSSGEVPTARPAACEGQMQYRARCWHGCGGVPRGGVPRDARVAPQAGTHYARMPVLATRARPHASASTHSTQARGKLASRWQHCFYSPRPCCACAGARRTSTASCPPSPR